MKKFNIGEYAHPCDNSYSYTIGELGKNPRLAGTSVPFVPAKKVKIVSLPYELKPDIHSPSLEFVTVLYDGKCHVVLNNFHADPCENCPFKNQ